MSECARELSFQNVRQFVGSLTGCALPVPGGQVCDCVYVYVCARTYWHEVARSGLLLVVCGVRRSAYCSGVCVCVWYVCSGLYSIAPRIPPGQGTWPQCKW